MADRFNVIETIYEFTDRSKRGVKSANAGLLSIGKTAKSILKNLSLTGTAIAALGGATVIGGVRRAVEELDNIGKQADKLGLTTDELQELRFAAVATSIPIQALDVGFQRFSRRVGEAQKGAGELNQTLVDLREGGNDIPLFTEEGLPRRSIDVFEDFLGVISGLDDASQKLAVGFKGFDTEGVALINLVRDGVDGFREMRQEARDLGVVIDESLIRESEELATRMDTLALVVRQNFNRAMIEAGPLVVFMAQRTAEFALSVAQLTANLADLDDAPARILVGRSQAIRDEIRELEEAIASNQRVLEEGATSGSESFIERLFGSSALTEQRTRELRAGIERMTSDLENLRGKLVEVEQLEAGRLVEIDPLQRKQLEALGIILEENARGASAATQTSDELAKSREKLARVTVALRQELALLNASSDAEIAALRRSFDLSNLVTRTVDQLEGIPKATLNAVREAAEQGPAALRAQIDSVRETSPALAEALTQAWRVYVATVREAREEGTAAVNELARQAREERAVFELEVDVDGLDEAQRKVRAIEAQSLRARLAAVRTFQQDAKAVLDAEVEDEADRQAALLALRGRFESEMAAITQKGANDRQALIEKEGDSLRDLFDIDVRETGGNALREFGDLSQQVMIDFITQTDSASEAARRLGENVAAMLARLGIEVGAKALGNAVLDQFPNLEGLLDGGSGEQDPQVGAAETQERAGQAMQEAADKQVNASGEMATSIGKEVVALAGRAAASAQETANATLFQAAVAQFGVFVQEFAAAAASQAVSEGIGSLGSVASAASGGITTQEGLVNVHPQEAIIPLRELRKMGAGGGVNFSQTINVTKDGATSTEQGSDLGDMGRRMRDLVVNVIEQEKRPGGALGPT